MGAGAFLSSVLDSWSKVFIALVFSDVGASTVIGIYILWAV